VDYVPNRFDYYAFRGAFPNLVEPNYLPFMTHAVSFQGRDLLIFCHWTRDRFPLPVYVSLPEIPAALQDEFAPTPPEAYERAVDDALEAWEKALEGLVRFRRVQRPQDAALRIDLLAEVAPAPEPSVTVLGRISMGHACRVRGAIDDWRLDVEFEAHDVRVYLADDYGLLTPDQVETVALHEIGHALGMRGHSPIPADLMYAIARDNPLVRGPSDLDVNSFVSLYNLPNGTVYARPDSPTRPPERSGPPPGPPLLAAAPHVDARFGYELRLPEGWQRFQTERGMIAADGLAWDYDATFQIIVRGYPTVAQYLARNGASHVGRGQVVEQRRLEVDGKPAWRLRVAGRTGPVMEELTFIQVGDGRVVVVIADCAAENYEAYRPWFQAILGTLDIARQAGRGARLPGPPSAP
jgi:hypothetical protein